MFGGVNHRDNKHGADQFLNDVWNSSDGVTWTEVTASAPVVAAQLLPG